MNFKTSAQYNPKLRLWHTAICQLWLFCLLLHPAFAQVFPAKPSSQVFDQAGALSSNDQAAIAGMIKQAKIAGEDLALAIINTCHGTPPRDYATALFNRWALGDAQSNRGVLIFIAVQDRKAEIILGSGIDGPTMRTQADQVMQNTMLPKFRDGDFGGGAFAGTAALLQQLFNLDFAAKPAEATNGATKLDAQSRAVEPAPKPPLSARQTTGYLLIGLSMLALPFVGTAWLIWRWYRRRSARDCPQCHTGLARLSETEDDQYLDEKAKAEERVKSVDHDVWVCLTCPHVERQAHHSWSTPYEKCPECRAKTFASYSEIRQAASRNDDGWGLIFGHCEACSYRSEHRFTVRREAEWRSGSAIGSYASSSTSSSRSSSGSSGGSARGGGASGSW